MVATRCARLRRAGDRHGPDGGDPLRPAARRGRPPRSRWWRPAAPGCAALAIATVPMVATRCARLRRAGDRHGPDGGDPLRPAAPRWRSPLDVGGVGLIHKQLAGAFDRLAADQIPGTHDALTLDVDAAARLQH